MGNMNKTDIKTLTNGGYVIASLLQILSQTYLRTYEEKGYLKIYVSKTLEQEKLIPRLPQPSNYTSDTGFIFCYRSPCKFCTQMVYNTSVMHQKSK